MTVLRWELSELASEPVLGLELDMLLEMALVCSGMVTEMVSDMEMVSGMHPESSLIGPVYFEVLNHV
jgi:hypothetical protein